LIARRMLDFPLQIIISVFDNNRLSWRKSNTAGRVPRLDDRELACRTAAHNSARPSSIGLL
jgi:hypothetical protein